MGGSFIVKHRTANGKMSGQHFIASESPWQLHNLEVHLVGRVLIRSRKRSKKTTQVMAQYSSESHVTGHTKRRRTAVERNVAEGRPTIGSIGSARLFERRRWLDTGGFRRQFSKKCGDVSCEPFISCRDPGWSHFRPQNLVSKCLSPRALAPKRAKVLDLPLREFQQGVYHLDTNLRSYKTKASASLSRQLRVEVIK